MNALYDINLNIGVAFMLVMLILFAIGTLIYAFGWLLVEAIRKRKAEWQPNVTITETGAGVVEPWQVTQDRAEWEELLGVFDFGEAEQ